MTFKRAWSDDGSYKKHSRKSTKQHIIGVRQSSKKYYSKNAPIIREKHRMKQPSPQPPSVQQLVESSAADLHISPPRSPSLGLKSLSAARNLQDGDGKASTAGAKDSDGIGAGLGLLALDPEAAGHPKSLKSPSTVISNRPDSQRLEESTVPSNSLPRMTLPAEMTPLSMSQRQMMGATGMLVLSRVQKAQLQVARLALGRLTPPSDDEARGWGSSGADSGPGPVLYLSERSLAGILAWRSAVEPTDHCPPDMVQWNQRDPRLAEIDRKALVAESNLPLFWPHLHERWFTAYPEEPALGLPLPSDPSAQPLTDSQRSDLAKAKKARHGVWKRLRRVYESLTSLQQLVSWFQRALRKQKGGVTAQAKANPVVDAFVKEATGTGKSRVHQPIEVFQKQHADEIHAEIARRGWSSMNEATRIEALGPDADEESLAEQKRQIKQAQAARMHLYKRVSQELWEKASPEVREEVSEQIKRETAEKEQKTKALEASDEGRTPAQYREGVEAIDSVLNLAHDTIERAAGWVGMTITGGPDSMGGLSVKINCWGTTDAGSTFRQIHPDFEAGIGDPFAEFLTRLFPKSIRDARIILKDDNGAEDVPSGCESASEGTEAPPSLVKPRRIRQRRRTRKDLPDLPPARSEPTAPPPSQPALAGPATAVVPAAPPNDTEAGTSEAVVLSASSHVQRPPTYADDDSVGRLLGVPTGIDWNSLTAFGDSDCDSGFDELFSSESFTPSPPIPTPSSLTDNTPRLRLPPFTVLSPFTTHTRAPTSLFAPQQLIGLVPFDSAAPAPTLTHHGRPHTPRETAVRCATRLCVKRTGELKSN
ncbi:hypothetical protein C8F01DRAFT_1235595 [Mycena amicta]|nr:hypothetical protein C8F01DRAFT_1235595 [Mycena amicta]